MGGINSYFMLYVSLFSNYIGDCFVGLRGIIYYR